MKLEQQVTSLELSKRLKELGVKQKSLYFWQQIGIRKGSLVQNQNTGHFDTNEITDWYSAFTVAELGEILKDKVTHSMPIFYEGEWIPSEYDPRGYVPTDTEAEARGLMLAYLIENKLMSV